MRRAASTQPASASSQTMLVRPPRPAVEGAQVILRTLQEAETSFSHQLLRGRALQRARRPEFSGQEHCHGRCASWEPLWSLSLAMSLKDAECYGHRLSETAMRLHTDINISLLKGASGLSVYCIRTNTTIALRFVYKRPTTISITFLFLVPFYS